MFHKGLLLTFLLDDKCVIHLSHPYPGGGGSAKSFLFKVLNVQVNQYGTNWGSHSCPHYLFIEFIFEKKNGYYAGRALIILICSTLIIQSYCTK